MGAAGGLAVDRDQIVPLRLQRLDPAFEAALEQDRIDAVDRRPQPARAGNSEMVENVNFSTFSVFELSKSLI